LWHDQAPGRRGREGRSTPTTLRKRARLDGDGNSQISKAAPEKSTEQRRWLARRRRRVRLATRGHKQAPRAIRSGPQTAAASVRPRRAARSSSASGSGFDSALLIGDAPAPIGQFRPPLERRQTTSSRRGALTSRPTPVNGCGPRPDCTWNKRTDVSRPALALGPPTQGLATAPPPGPRSSRSPPPGRRGSLASGVDPYRLGWRSIMGPALGPWWGPTASTGGQPRYRHERPLFVHDDRAQGARVVSGGGLAVARFSGCTAP